MFKAKILSSAFVIIFPITSLFTTTAQADVLCARIKSSGENSAVHLFKKNKCPKGFRNVPNDVLSQGPIGATGPQGLQGATGATGANGSAGIEGAAGANGSTGPTGDAGVAGATGATGATGNIGVTGSTGQDGAIGFNYSGSSDGNLALGPIDRNFMAANAIGATTGIDNPGSLVPEDPIAGTPCTEVAFYAKTSAPVGVGQPNLVFQLAVQDPFVDGIILDGAFLCEITTGNDSCEASNVVVGIDPENTIAFSAFALGSSTDTLSVVWNIRCTS